jgi:hypothetical protein
MRALAPKSKGSAHELAVKAHKLRLIAEPSALLWWTMYSNGVDLLVRLGEDSTVEVFVHGLIPKKFEPSVTIHYIKVWEVVFTKHGYCPKTITQAVRLAITSGAGTQTSLI